MLKNTIETREPMKKGVQVLGPAEAPIQKISSRFRWQILLKSPSSALLNSLVKSVREDTGARPGSDVTLVIDVDPYSLM